MKPEFKQIADECGLYISYHNEEASMLEIEFFAEQVVKKCCEILNDKRFDNVRPSINIAQAMMKEHFEIKQ